MPLHQTGMKTRNWIPRDHINPTQAWGSTCNPSTQKAETRILRPTWLPRLAEPASSRLSEK